MHLDGCAPIHRLQLVCNGDVARTWEFPDGRVRGTFRGRLPIATDGWLAARCYSRTRDSYLQELFAHTSPTYVRTGSPNPYRSRDAAFFVERIDDTLDQWVGHRFRYATDTQRESVRELFRAGREVYQRL